MAYVDVEGYAKRYGAVPLEDEEIIDTLLTDACDIIDVRLERYGMLPLEDERKQRIAARIACEMVHQIASVPEELTAYKQMSMTAGPYTQSGTIANPGGRLFLSPAHLRDLGIGGGRVTFVGPKIGYGEES